MKIVKLPCGEVREALDQIPDHMVIEDSCMDNCSFMMSCGRFWDWFNKKHHRVK